MNLAGGGPKFASFAKSGDKIANLATLFISNTVKFQLVLLLNFSKNLTSFVAYLLLIFLMILNSLLLKKLL